MDSRLQRSSCNFEACRENANAKQRVMIINIKIIIIFAIISLKNFIVLVTAINIKNFSILVTIINIKIIIIFATISSRISLSSSSPSSSRSSLSSWLSCLSGRRWRTVQRTTSAPNKRSGCNTMMTLTCLNNRCNVACAIFFTKDPTL